MARSLPPEAVTVEDVISACGGESPPAPVLPKDISPLPKPSDDAPNAMRLPLPIWRKVLAAISGVAALVLFIQILGVTDLSALIGQEGLTSLSVAQMQIYGCFTATLIAFAISVSCKSNRAGYLLQTPKAKRKLMKRTIVATVLILLLMPLTLFIGETYLAGQKYYFIMPLVLLECMIPFSSPLREEKPQARELVIFAALCAIAVAGRAAFFMLLQFKPVFVQLFPAQPLAARQAFCGRYGHAHIQHYVFTFAVDSMANVRHGYHRVLGRDTISQGIAAAFQRSFGGIRCADNHPGLRRHYESGICYDLFPWTVCPLPPPSCSSGLLGNPCWKSWTESRSNMAW